MKKHTDQKKEGGRRNRASPRKIRTLTGASSRRANTCLAERPPRGAGSKPTIDSLTGDLPAVTLRSFHEVLFHFERVDPRLAEAWRRDVAVHEGAITLRRVMSPENFGGATHYAYVDRRLLWYLKRDPSDPAGARWEGYLTNASDAPPDTVAVVAGRNITVKKILQSLEDGVQIKALGETASTVEVSTVPYGSP